MSTFVGYQKAELIDEELDITFPMAVVYPTTIPSRPERLGPYSLDVSMDAAPKEGAFPLVLISHGSGGTPLVYRTLAHHLARNGFVVGLPEHPFNNRNDDSWAFTTLNLTHRPRHLRLAADWFFAGEKFAPSFVPDSVSIIGHSMGGYAALAAAGGVPTSFPHESADGQSHQVSVMPDPRIKALVLLAPASIWFRAKGALSDVTVPILMLVGEKDEYTPEQPYARIILRGVPDTSKVQRRIIENAGHFSFLSPFPEAMTNATFLPSQDPPGFDRVSFHEELNAEVLKFLLRETAR